MPDASIQEPHLQAGWNSKQVYGTAVVCLAVGLLAGYLVRGSDSLGAATSAETPSSTAAPGKVPEAGGHPMPTMEQMKKMADTMAAPLLEQLKKEPNNSKVLIQLAAVYSKTHQFREAAGYYEQAVKLEPKNVDLRNEMASCLYYIGDADGALAQLQQSLKYEPNNVNALFNLGMVRWKGKNDATGAIAAWQQLLHKNPNLDRKSVVEKMIAEARTQTSVTN